MIATITTIVTIPAPDDAREHHPHHDQRRDDRRCRSAGAAPCASSFSSETPSRIAAIGVTRAARIAGQQTGEHGHRGAGEQRHPDRAELEDRAAVGQVGAERLEQLVEARAPARSRPASPTLAPPRPSITPSAMTEPTTCARVAPSVRSSPNSRVRWATVIEKVLKMMNAPTNSET